MANNGFSAQHDYFGFNGATYANGAAPCVSSDAGHSRSTAESPGSHGDPAARDVYGNAYAPKCSYKVKADIAAAKWIPLGTVVAAPGNGVALPVMVTTVEISTGAGVEPSVTVSGVGVEAGAAAGRTFPLSGIGSLSKLCMAQILGSACTVSGGNVTSSSLAASCEGHPVEVGGEPVASDCWGGRMEARLTIESPAGSAPTLTAGTGWDVTQPPTPSDSDGGYTNYECALVKTLAATEPSP
jgi:hypothetical protein